MKKASQMLIAFLLMSGSIFCDRLWLKTKANAENNWVYSVNNESADANGNVNITAVNNKTVNSNVPANVNFSEYNQNIEDVAEIKDTLSSVTATLFDVNEGKTAITVGGEKANGLNRGFSKYDLDMDGLIIDKDMSIIRNYGVMEQTTGIFNALKNRADVNKDGLLDSNDITHIAEILTDYNGALDTEGVSGYDVNGDGVINNADYEAVNAIVLNPNDNTVKQYLITNGYVGDLDLNGSKTVSDIITVRDAAEFSLSLKQINTPVFETAITADGYITGINRGLTKEDLNSDGCINQIDIDIVNAIINGDKATFANLITLRGDINGNGSFDSSDQQIFNAIMQEIPDGSEDRYGVSGFDINGDDIIDSNDITAFEALSSNNSDTIWNALCSGFVHVGDVNSDLSVDSTDVTEIQSKFSTDLTEIFNGTVLSATPADVVSGKTFYSGSGIQTGTFSPSITVLATYSETKVGIDEYCTWDVTKTAPAGTTHVFLHYVKYGGSGGWLNWYKNGSQFSPGNNTIQPCSAGNTIRYYSRTYGTGGSTNRYADTYLISFLKLN